MNLTVILAYEFMGDNNKIKSRIRKKRRRRREKGRRGRKEERRGVADVEADRNRFKEDRGQRHTERNSSFDLIGQISDCLGSKNKYLLKTVDYCKENCSCE